MGIFSHRHSPYFPRNPSFMQWHGKNNLLVIASKLVIFVVHFSRLGVLTSLIEGVPTAAIPLAHTIIHHAYTKCLALGSLIVIPAWLKISAGFKLKYPNKKYRSDNHP
jgi:hypothetical protein